MDYQTISVEFVEKVCILNFCRPEKMNIIGNEFLDEFEHVIDRVFNNDDIRVLIITGNIDVFSAGGDLKLIQKTKPEEVKLLNTRVQKAFSSLMSINIPVIAAISGIAYGGGIELAIHCDIRFCSENTKLRFPESDFGLIPGAGGISILSKYFSNSDIAYYLMSGEEIPLEKALNSGLIQKIYSKKELISKTYEFAENLSQKSKFSLSAIKGILNSGYFKSTEECMQLEIEEFASCLNNGGRDKIKKFFYK